MIKMHDDLERLWYDRQYNNNNLYLESNMENQIKMTPSTFLLKKHTFCTTFPESLWFNTIF